MQVFVTSQYLAIAMEYAAGGDMFEHVVRKGGLKESEARWFFQQLLVGVDYVHRMVSACQSQLRTLVQLFSLVERLVSKLLSAAIAWSLYQSLTLSGAGCRVLQTGISS